MCLCVGVCLLMSSGPCACIVCVCPCVLNNLLCVVCSFVGHYMYVLFVFDRACLFMCFVYEVCPCAPLFVCPCVCIVVCV